MRVRKCNFNIDKLRICYRQPAGLYDLFLGYEAKTEIERDCYKIRILSDTRSEETKEYHRNLIGAHAPLMNASILDESETYKIDNIQVQVICADGTLLGTFKFNNSKKYEGLCFFTFENSALYKVFNNIAGQKNNYICCLDYVADDLGLEFNNITELEVAADTNFNLTAAIRRHISHFDEYRMFVNGAEVGDPYRKIDDYLEGYGRCRAHLFRSPTIYISQKKNGSPFLRAYNKTAEINDNLSVKKYISEWNAFGAADIHRLEVNIRSEDFKDFYEKYGGDDWILTALQDPAFLESLWSAFCRRLLYFRAAEGGHLITIADIIAA